MRRNLIKSQNLQFCCQLLCLGFILSFFFFFKNEVLIEVSCVACKKHIKLTPHTSFPSHWADADNDQSSNETQTVAHHFRAVLNTSCTKVDQHVLKGTTFILMANGSHFLLVLHFSFTEARRVTSQTAEQHHKRFCQLIRECMISPPPATGGLREKNDSQTKSRLLWRSSYSHDPIQTPKRSTGY